MDSKYFGDSNVMMIFIIAVISIFTYTNFSEKQRFFLIYLLSYGTVFWDILGFRETAVLLLIATFVYLEYLTEDTKKIELIVKIGYKLVDYIYMMFFQYHICWIIFAFICLWIHKQQYLVNDLPLYFSVILLFIGEHNTISQRFKIASITETLRVFEVQPIYSFSYTKDMQRKFDMLCTFEDKSYFCRKRSYSCVSVEYGFFFLSNLLTHLMANRSVSRKILYIKNIKKNSIIVRGYSTPEMQLLRTIGVVRGYERHKIARKIYEILYSKIIFTSLQDYYQQNTYKGLQYFRHYLLDIYISTVPVRIHGHKYTPMSSVFGNKPYQNWSDEEMFIACLGLSFRDVNKNNLEIFNDIILNFHLDKEKIREISKNLPK